MLINLNKNAVETKAFKLLFNTIISYTCDHIFIIYVNLETKTDYYEYIFMLGHYIYREVCVVYTSKNWYIFCSLCFSSHFKSYLRQQKVWTFYRIYVWVDGKHFLIAKGNEKRRLLAISALFTINRVEWILLLKFIFNEINFANCWKHFLL